MNLSTFTKSWVSIYCKHDSGPRPWPSNQQVTYQQMSQWPRARVNWKFGSLSELASRMGGNLNRDGLVSA
jgi:hypothetical protein